MPLDSDDFIGLLSSDDEDLPSFSKPMGPQPPAIRQATTEDDWQDDPVSTKLEKIRAAFLNGKTAAQVAGEAALMPMGDWLELVVKLSPKNVQVSGAVSFKHMLEELGPIDKEQYRLSGPIGEVIEAEVAE